jgi:hypothetical protein
MPWLAASRVGVELHSNAPKKIPVVVYTVPPDDEQISARNM